MNKWIWGFVMAGNTSINAEQIIVIDKNGNLKLIAPGEKVLPGEIAVEGSSGRLVVSSIDLPEKNDDINAILNAIVDGQDPSLIAEAPAAGENSGSSLTTSAEIERVGKSTIAETNFDTSSLESLGLSKTQSLTLLDQYKAYGETEEFQVPNSNNGLVKTAPTLFIQEIDENGVINEERAENGIQVDVVLPTGTEKGDRIELRDGEGTVVGEHLITEDDITNGKVEITVQTPENDRGYEYVADITDPSGDKGPRSNEVEFELDTKVLTETDGDGDAGITSDITDSTNSGSNDDTITNVNTPDITGVTEAGATVTITYTDATDTVRTATGTADANGVYTIAITNELKEGSNSLNIAAKDTAGNTTNATQDVTVDTMADNDGDGVTVAITGITEDTGTAGDYVTTDNTLKISGTVDVDDNNTL
ncbi:MAG: hypothetical protein GY920_18105, partial [Aliivibrio sp.]|nr:hypothetical protein [Aliivibrio sp.]